MRETDLYLPVKRLLEAQGYDVKGEVRGCDLVGVRGDEPPVVVELKRGFSLALLLQGVDRQALTERVYLAVPRLGERGHLKLCRMLGLGVIVVADDRAEPVLDPQPYQPRKKRRDTARLLREHRLRVGDPTLGGSVGQPIMTAYRQEAIRCAALLAERGAARVAEIRRDAAAANAARILQQNVYGWFERVARATYRLSPRGHASLGPS